MFLLIMLWIFIIIICGCLYVIGAFGLYHLAENLRIENSWLAWVPVANLYLLGKMIGSVKIADRRIGYLELILPIGFVLALSMINIPIIAQLLCIAYSVIFITALYKLYLNCRPESAVLYTVLSAVGLFPIIFYLIKDDTPNELF